MRPVTDFEIVEAMARYGGSFMRALATAAHHADPVNLEKLKRAFAEEWDEYRRLAERQRRPPEGAA